jgi:hypothetical protein
VHVSAVVWADLTLLNDSNKNEQLFINLATVMGSEYLLSRLRKAVAVVCHAIIVL